MQISEKKVVSIDYKLSDDNGSVIDQSDKENPLVYMHGIGNLIPGLESALEGKTSGENVKVTVKPEEGYGMRNNNLIVDIPQTQFQGVDEVKVGMQFQLQAEDGVHIGTVQEVKGDNVTMDLNHPLAGQNLHFDVDIMDVREASQEELDHGHAH